MQKLDKSNLEAMYGYSVVKCDIFYISDWLLINTILIYSSYINKNFENH